MDFGGIIAGALGGGAKAVGDIAQGQIEANQRADLMRLQSDVDEQKQMRINAAKAQMDVDMAQKERDRVQSIIGPAAQGKTGLEAIVAQRDAARNAGDMATAMALDKQIDSGTKAVAPYTDLVDSTGKLIHHNSGVDKPVPGSARDAQQRQAEFDKILVKMRDSAVVEDPAGVGKPSQSPGLYNVAANAAQQAYAQGASADAAMVAGLNAMDDMKRKANSIVKTATEKYKNSGFLGMGKGDQPPTFEQAITMAKQMDAKFAEDAKKKKDAAAAQPPQAAAAPAPSPADPAAASGVVARSMPDFLGTPQRAAAGIEALPTEVLQGYTKNHPDYPRVKAELDRRKRAQEDAELRKGISPALRDALNR